jgi:hypothetical protein
VAIVRSIDHSIHGNLGACASLGGRFFFVPLTVVEKKGKSDTQLRLSADNVAFFYYFSCVSFDDRVRKRSSTSAYKSRIFAQES